MKKLSMLVGLLALTACASGRDPGSVTYEYREQDRINQFEDFRRQCLGRGGIIVVTARSRVARSNLPGPMDDYACRRGRGRGLSILY